MATEQQSLSCLPAKLSTDPRFGQICLICCCSPAAEQGAFFSYGTDEPPYEMDRCLFLFDLDEERSQTTEIPRNPNVCFNISELGVSGFCVLRSTLYLFGEGEDVVHKFELPPSLPSPVLQLTKDMLSAVACPMKYPKSHPVACQTPDGKKMLVFSGILSSDVGGKSGIFELLDPDRGSWTQLPDLIPLMKRLFDRYEDWDDVDVQSYAFVDNGPNLLITTELGNFTLNVEDPEIGWSQCDRFRYPHNEPEVRMLVRDSLCLMDCYAWVDGTNRYQLLSYPPGLESMSTDGCGAGITWLSPVDHFCYARSGVDDMELKAHLIVDVCGFELNEFQRNKKNLVEREHARSVRQVPGVKLMKRFKYVVGPQSREDGFDTISLFSMS